MFEYDKECMKAVETLDKYDFTSILKGCWWDDVEDIARSFRRVNDDVSDAVDYLSCEEFILYLRKRYGMSSEEVVSYKLCWNSKSGRVA